MLNQEQLQGQWQQLRGKFLKKWGKLTDDDLSQSKGNQEILMGKMAERYGITKEKATKKLNKFLSQLDDKGNEILSLSNNLSNMTERVNENMHEMVKSCQHCAKNKPFATLAIAAATGALLGAIMMRSKR